MIEQRQGDVLAVPSGIIVHGTNCQGVMGSGIARTVRERYPRVFNTYFDEYQSKTNPLNGQSCGLVLGQITFDRVDDTKWIVNANTQHLYGTDSRKVNYEAVAQCFEKVVELAQFIEKETGDKLEILFPLIGAGLGGGNWKIIETIIDETIPDHFVKAVYHFVP